jgi:hypothetical protein
LAYAEGTLGYSFRISTWGFSYKLVTKEVAMYNQSVFPFPGSSGYSSGKGSGKGAYIHPLRKRRKSSDEKNLEFDFEYSNNEDINKHIQEFNKLFSVIPKVLVSIRTKNPNQVVCDLNKLKKDLEVFKKSISNNDQNNSLLTSTSVLEDCSSEILIINKDYQENRKNFKITVCFGIIGIVLGIISILVTLITFLFSLVNGS